MTPRKIIGEKNSIANVKIISDGANAQVFLDEKKVNGLIGYEIVHDRTKSQIPIIRLNIQAKLDIETGMILEIPEPWSFFVKANVKSKCEKNIKNFNGPQK